MIRISLAIGMALSLLGAVAPPGAHAAQPESTTVLTFTEPVEIPGQVLPAGSYAFSLLESMTDRHIVRISSADGTRVLATVMTVPHYRLDKTSGTVLTYRAGDVGVPAALRAWYHPNDTVGHEFVYPRSRAAAIAMLADERVHALPGDEYDPTQFRSVSIEAVGVNRADPVVSPGIERPGTVTGARMDTPPPPAEDAPARSALPATATTLPVLLLLGLGGLATALGLLMLLWRSAPVAGV